MVIYNGGKNYMEISLEECNKWTPFHTSHLMKHIEQHLI